MWLLINSWFFACLFVLSWSWPLMIWLICMKRMWLKNWLVCTRKLLENAYFLKDSTYNCLIWLIFLFQLWIDCSKWASQCCAFMFMFMFCFVRMLILKEIQSNKSQLDIWFYNSFGCILILFISDFMLCLNLGPHD
mgnify:CR=1 FL=1